MASSRRLLLIISLLCLLATLCTARGGGGGGRGGGRGRYGGGGGGGGGNVIILAFVFGSIGLFFVIGCCYICYKYHNPSESETQGSVMNAPNPSQAMMAAPTDGHVPHGQTYYPGTSPDGRNDYSTAYSDTPKNAATYGYPESKAPIGTAPPSYDAVMGRGDPGGPPYHTAPPANGSYGINHSNTTPTTDNPLPYSTYTPRQ